MTTPAEPIFTAADHDSKSDIDQSAFPTLSKDRSNSMDEKLSYEDEEKKAGQETVDINSIAPSDLLADGTERPIETAHVSYSFSLSSSYPSRIA
jgi:hypothetical protein